ncbi:Non-specific lipid-transfer protein [Neolecta irregularis DAH-3]|uniref:propanoyl-CoA C-acyltransferase n=1 Tax=Neolecta irregularis (strain DAH-3) TaxID=1198029 RepID=A0A1U7LWC4_NEOID|nr:Non-specific lipid-transfer protein [Neolecta irregularis DAH-3]|eukprot:OLL26980.1 Non-specific lipid-transfer protein [Neolecta irregularis DAH-3]
MSKSKVYVAGVGMTKFVKPKGEIDYVDSGLEAAVKALIDAGINYDEVNQGIACYVYGDSTSGQRVFYQLGLTQIPIYNVNNNCSTGSTGLFMAKQLIEHGVSDCILVIGFEQMQRGSLKSVFSDRTNPLDRSIFLMANTRGMTTAPVAAQLFGNAGTEYCEKYGATADHLAHIAEINHRHSKSNPYSQSQKVYTLDEILKSPQIHGPLTKLQCCPTSDGAAAVVLCSQRFLDSHPHIKSQAIEIAGQCLATDSPSLFNKSAIELVGADMTRHAADQVYKEAGITADEIQVVELHDCFSANELVCIDALGLSKPGKAHELVETDQITYGGKYVINPSGGTRHLLFMIIPLQRGLISKGHPLGATGLAQASELVWQLRGWATNRQVPNCKYALQHNVGLGGAVVVTVYKRLDGCAVSSGMNSMEDGRKRLGYNPAVEARGITEEMTLKVQSKKYRSNWMMSKEGRSARL